MPEMYLIWPGFPGQPGPFKKTKKEHKNLKKQEIHDIFNKKSQIKLVFNMTWLMEILNIQIEVKAILASDKILCDKAFNIAKNPKYDGYQREIASMAYKFFDKKTSASGIKNEKMSHE